MNQALVEELYSHRREEDGYLTVLGGTLCTDDFYEGNHVCVCVYVCVCVSYCNFIG